MKKKRIKKKRNPPGYRETDRMCALCNKKIFKKVGLHRHHLSYEHNILVSLHAYSCHNIVHGRMKYRCPFDHKYGVDYSPVFRSISILNMYKRVMPVIRKKFPLETFDV